MAVNPVNGAWDFSFAVGGLTIALASDDRPLLEALARRYEPWLVEGPSLCRVQVRCGQGQRMPNRPSPAASFDQGRACHLRAPGYHGVIAADGCSGTLELAVADEADADYFLRAVLAVLAFEAGGLLVHAAGFLRRGRAVLLTGRSGIGKSTSVRVSAGLPDTVALGDDLILLMPTADGWWAHGTPFWNPEAPAALRIGQTASGPLAGLFRLAQDRRDWVQPLSAGQLVAGLMSDLPIVPLDTVRASQAFALLARLARTVATGQLHFRPTPDFWSVLDEFILSSVPVQPHQAPQ
ncbi:MAG: hypothetical protein NZ528_00470 [Caldilineales bacterium]|nr:hypothetical protein [Caldilineales bacterium]MDW8317762.1 hypothetical protein [Anaerolineae bacterium]